MDTDEPGALMDDHAWQKTDAGYACRNCPAVLTPDMVRSIAGTCPERSIDVVRRNYAAVRGRVRELLSTEAPEALFEIGYREGRVIVNVHQENKPQHFTWTAKTAREIAALLVAAADLIGEEPR